MFELTVLLVRKEVYFYSRFMNKKVYFPSHLQGLPYDRKGGGYPIRNKLADKPPSKGKRLMVKNALPMPPVICMVSSGLSVGASAQETEEEST